MNRKLLSDALQKLYPTVATSPIVAEMGDFRFADDVIRASDGVTMVQVSLDEPTGLDCLVPAGKLYKLLSSLKTEDVRLTLKEGDDNQGRLTVSGGRSRGSYAVTIGDGGVLDALGFDGIGDWEPIPKGLLDGIELCRFSAARDASRGPLCGVMLGGKRVVGSDGTRISIFRLTKDIGEPIIIPAALASLLSHYKDRVTAWFRTETAVYFKADVNVYIGANLLTGQYPDTEAFLEQAKEFKDTLAFPDGTADALRVHRAQQADVSDEGREVLVKFDGKGMTIHSEDEGRTYELTDTLDLGKTVGKALAYKIHPMVLADILGRTNEMKYDDKKKFICFKTKEGFTHLAVVERV